MIDLIDIDPPAFIPDVWRIVRGGNWVKSKIEQHPNQESSSRSYSSHFTVDVVLCSVMHYAPDYWMLALEEGRVIDNMEIVNLLEEAITPSIQMKFPLLYSRNIHWELPKEIQTKIYEIIKRNAEKKAI
jgi:hypothetical protein